MAALKYITIIISALIILLAAAIGISESNLWLTIIAIAFYSVVLYLVYDSNNKNSKTGYWVAFVLAILPFIGFIILLSFIGRMGC